MATYPSFAYDSRKQYFYGKYDKNDHKFGPQNKNKNSNFDEVVIVSSLLSCHLGEVMIS